MKTITKLSAASLLLFSSLSVLVATSPANAFTIVPPRSEVAGKTIGEWTGEWWKWAFSQSVPMDAFTDQTGENANVNQSGPVFFVAGTTGGEATRSFNVPSNKYLLFPLVNVSISELGFPELSVRERIDLATGTVNLIDSLIAEIDGVPINNPFNFRETTPELFSYEAVENNPFGTPVGLAERAFADGYYVMVEPLASGTTSTFTFGGGASQFSFSTKVTAKLIHI